MLQRKIVGRAGDLGKTSLEMEIDIQKLPRLDARARIPGKVHSCSRP